MDVTGCTVYPYWDLEKKKKKGLNNYLESLICFLFSYTCRYKTKKKKNVRSITRAVLKTSVKLNSNE